MPLPGRVVILNGTSSAGKSTIVELFRQQRAACGEWWLPVAIDEFNVKVLAPWFEGPGYHGLFGGEGVQFTLAPEGMHVSVGERGRRLHAAYHRTVAVCARQGFDVVVDEVAIDEESVRDWQVALAGLRVTWVAVRCDPEVAEARERARGDRALGLARGLSGVVHQHAPYDLQLDATRAEPADLVSQLTSYICGAPGQAPSLLDEVRSQPTGGIGTTA